MTPEQSVANFRRNIRSLLTETGAQARLAERAGIDRHYLSALLAGKKTPGLALAYKIAEAAGFDLAQLALPEKKFRATALGRR